MLMVIGEATVVTLETDLAALTTISIIHVHCFCSSISFGRIQVEALINSLISVIVVIVVVVIRLGSKPNAALSALKIRRHCYVQYVGQECVVVV